MLGMGVVSDMIGGRAIWGVPATFTAFMVIGALSGGLNVKLPSPVVETGIAMSVILLGLLIAIRRQLPPIYVAIPVAFFGIFHGRAHGTEIPRIVDPVLYALGFMSGTIAIHLSGVLIGDLSRRCVHGPLALSLSGGAFVMTGGVVLGRSSLMATVTDSGSQKTGGSTGRPAVYRRAVILWEAGALVFIVLGASALHFLYELSGLQPWATIFGSVNESTFEHLKLFFWPAIAWAFVQHVYTRDRVMNFWWAKALSIITAPLVLMLSFYFYLGISLPIFGRGFLWADIGTGVLGVLAGNVVSYRVMTAPEKGRGFARLGLAICVAMGVMFIAFTYLPPRFFLFENFARYQYSGEYGTLEGYTPYLVFRKAS